MLAATTQHQRHGESLQALREELIAFAEKEREWDQHDF
jgi:hypothetical protein